MAGVSNVAESVTVVCEQACSVPAYGIIMKAGEEREVAFEVAETLVQTGRFRRKERRQAEQTKEQVAMEIAELAAETPDEPEATPSAQKLAEQSGIDLRDVVGSGENGKILKSDVIAYMEDEK